MEKKWKWNGCRTMEEAAARHRADHTNKVRTPSEYHIENAGRMADILRNAAIRNEEMITIVGDYDTDGACVTAEMYMALKSLGATKITIHLQRRMTDGYGLKESIVDGISDGILLTLDNGIAAVSAIRKAKEKGLTVLVIDHHLPPVENGKAFLPPADLIVDPNAVCGPDADPDEFREWCASGLAYRIAEMMGVDDRTLRDISVDAMFATIADVVELTGDNRNIYSEGHENAEMGYGTAGARTLISFLRSDGHFYEKDIGFKIGPMLNAPGRIYDDGVRKSIETLLCTDPDRAESLVRELSDINDYRKREKERAVRRADEIIVRNGMAGTNPIIVIDNDAPEGIVGLVAGDIREKYNVTSVVLTKSGNVLKGSGRASGYDNLKEALDKVNELDPGIFLGYGGHRAAAGVTIRPEKAEDFIRLMTRVLPPAREPDPFISYDLEISPADLVRTADELERYRPFGQGDEDIAFRISHFRTVPSGGDFFQKIGTDSVKLLGAGCEAVGFSMLERYEEIGEPKNLDLVGTLSYHWFNGKRTPQIEIIDMKPSQEENHARRNGLSMEIEGLLQEGGLGGPEWAKKD